MTAEKDKSLSYMKSITLLVYLSGWGSCVWCMHISSLWKKKHVCSHILWPFQALAKNGSRKKLKIKHTAEVPCIENLQLLLIFSQNAKHREHLGYLLREIAPQNKTKNHLKHIHENYQQHLSFNGFLKQSELCPYGSKHLLCAGNRSRQKKSSVFPSYLSREGWRDKEERIRHHLYSTEQLWELRWNTHTMDI